MVDDQKASAADPLPPGGFARAYQRLRGGKAFTIGLALGIAGWLAASMVFPRLDPDFGRINFFLSAEASLSQAASYAVLMTILGSILSLLHVMRRVLVDVEQMTRRNVELLEIGRDALRMAADGARRSPAGRGLGATGVAEEA